MKFWIIFSLVFVGTFGMQCYQCTEDDVYGNVNCFEAEMDYQSENSRANNCNACMVDKISRYFNNGTEEHEITRGCSHTKSRAYEVHVILGPCLVAMRVRPKIWLKSWLGRE